MLSNTFCGCKATDFCNQLPGSTCLVLDSSDIRSSLIGYEQVMRRMLDHAYKRSEKVPYELTIIVNNNGGIVDKDIIDEISSLMGSIWNETNEGTDFRQFLGELMNVKYYENY